MTNITINNQKHTIELTKKDYDKACKFGTQEYLDLQEAASRIPIIRLRGLFASLPSPLSRA